MKKTSLIQVRLSVQWYYYNPIDIVIVNDKKKLNKNWSEVGRNT